LDFPEKTPETAPKTLRFRPAYGREHGKSVYCLGSYGLGI
jgi:hypothetical protein